MHMKIVSELFVNLAPMDKKTIEVAATNRSKTTERIKWRTTKDTAKVTRQKMKMKRWVLTDLSIEIKSKNYNSS